MKDRKKRFGLVIYSFMIAMTVLLVSPGSFAEKPGDSNIVLDSDKSEPSGKTGKTISGRPSDIMKPSTQWFLSYIWGNKDGKSYNKESITRGYLTVKFQPVSWFEPRVTMDVHQDEKGDFKVRMKYLYGKFVIPVETSWITEPALEFGLVHGPWFDYEEHVNRYRAQGTMFIERNGILNSADLGLTFNALLGRRLPRDYQEKISSKYPGKWGSISFGVYNGGGYHASEENQNKVFESRVTLRPLGWIFPNLSLSHFFIYGKGNTRRKVCDDQGHCIAGEPEWLLNSAMLAVEHEYFVLTGQVLFGKGNQKGSQVDANGDAVSSFGYSGFLEVKLPWIMSSLIARYDHFRWDKEITDRVIGGFAFHFYRHNYVLLNLDWLMHEGSSKPDDWQAGLVLQVEVP
ncbi:MAG: hypothetical protein GXP49_16090 [Deltaproteobacteria bacterium]|nr:hypothetical protein [Deltaproteobacteria bacterium]